VDNYFNYFTEIEEHFQRRRGSGLLLSTLDWALIETWKDAGIPLEAVLRGIDAAWERYEQRPRTKKINSLAYCSQEVLTAAEEMKEASVGAQREEKPGSTLGFDPRDIAAFLRRNAAKLESATLPTSSGISAQPLAQESARTLRELATDLETSGSPRRLEDLERRMTVLEEKLMAMLLSTTPDEEIVSLRAQADRELAPYRSKMPVAQIEQLQRQYLHKRLFERYLLPRLSLFYM
jgi:hypothetical protein